MIPLNEFHRAAKTLGSTIVLFVAIFYGSSASAQSIPSMTQELRQAIDNPQVTDADLNAKLSPLLQQVERSFALSEEVLNSAHEAISSLNTSMGSLRERVQAFEFRAEQSRSYSPQDLRRFKLELEELRSMFARVDEQTVPAAEIADSVTKLMNGLDGHHKFVRKKLFQPAQQPRLQTPKELEEALRRGQEIRSMTHMQLMELERKISALESRVELKKAIPGVSLGTPLFSNDPNEYKIPEPKESRIDPAPYLLRSIPDATIAVSVGKKLVQLYADCQLNRDETESPGGLPRTAFDKFKTDIRTAQFSLLRHEHPEARELVEAALRDVETANVDFTKLRVLNDLKPEKEYSFLVAGAVEDLLQGVVVIDSSDPENPKLAEDGCNPSVDLLRQLDTPDSGAEPLGRSAFHYINPFWLKHIIDMSTSSIIRDEGKSFDLATKKLFEEAHAAEQAGDDERAAMLYGKIRQFKVQTLKTISARTADFLSPFQVVNDVMEETTVVPASLLLDMLHGYRKTSITELNRLGKIAVRYAEALHKNTNANWDELGLMQLFWDPAERRKVHEIINGMQGKDPAILFSAIQYLESPCRDGSATCPVSQLKTRTELYEKGFLVGEHALVRMFRNLDGLPIEAVKKFQEEVTKSREKMLLVKEVVVTVAAMAVATALAPETGGSSYVAAVAFISADIAASTSVAGADLYFGRPLDRVMPDLAADLTVAVVDAATMGATKGSLGLLGRARFIQWMNSNMPLRVGMSLAENAGLGAIRGGVNYLGRFIVYNGRFPTNSQELEALGQSMQMGALTGAFYGSLGRVAGNFAAASKFQGLTGRRRLETLRTQSTSAPIKLNISKDLPVSKQIEEFASKSCATPGTVYLVYVPLRLPGKIGRAFLDVPHWQILYMTKDKQLRRVTANPFMPKVVTDVDKVQNMVAFKLNNMTKDQVDTLYRLTENDGVKIGGNRYLSLVEGNCSTSACNFLSQLKFQMGDKTRVLPTENARTLLRGIKNSVGQPVKVSVYETGDTAERLFIGGKAPLQIPGILKGDIQIAMLPLWITGGVDVMQVLTGKEPRAFTTAFFWPLDVMHVITEQPRPGTLPPTQFTNGYLVIPPPSASGGGIRK